MNVLYSTKFHELTEEYLQKVFIEENKTTQEIAASIGCARITVYKHLEKFGIKKRKKV